MPTLASVATTYSDFPDSLDQFATVTNGTGSTSAVNAEHWNHLESALYLLEGHTQANLHVTGNNSRKRLCLHTTVTLSGATGYSEVLFTLTADQLDYLGGAAWQPGGALLADVRCYSSTETTAYTTDLQLVPPAGVRVRFQQIDYDAEAPNDVNYRMVAGSYRVSLTLLGA
jgi:hypothetical protein